ncbi:sensor histidine kinase [Salinicoccus albus]|uniref:sensor histidine kinase n=1 Tax=Salinicoccus albus TaxID=418756 RepID=UPI00037BF1F3|nr:ATP-binding protein [Salinicoccus albus]
MKKLNSVVMKLWLTIILIVTTVLIILSVILSLYFRNYMLNSTETLLEEEITRAEENILAEHDIEDLNTSLLREENLIVYYDGQMLSRQSATDRAVFQRVMDSGSEGNTYILDNINDHSYMAKVSDLSDYFASDAAVIKYSDLEDINESMAAVTMIIVGSALVLFLITTSFAFFLISRITRPLIRLKDSAFKTARGDYNTLEVKNRDEIGELTLAFNKMNNDIQNNINQIVHERNLREQIFTSMNEGVLYFDSDASLIYSNRKGNLLYDSAQNEKDKFDTLNKDIKDVAETKASAVERVEINDRHLQFAYTPVEKDSEHFGVILLIRDITQEVNTEKMRSEFIANVSHELKTPMVMLSGYSEALQDEIVTDPKEVREMAGIIKDESDRMNTMVNELITIARMDSRSDFFNIGENDLGVLLDKLKSRLRKEMDDNDIDFLVDIGGIDPVFDFDYDKLDQVLTNLVDNAIRYTSEGDRISILARDSGHFKVIEISDTGTGIMPEHRERVFERFYKVDESRTRGKHGTGLGLYIVRSIIHRHNGTIELESEYGEGTTFRVILPKSNAEG